MTEKAKNYAATFSNGETITRRSHHDYSHAWCVFDNDTGEICHCGFSSREPRPSVSHFVTGYARRAYPPTKQGRTLYNIDKIERARRYRFEFVNVEVIL